MSTNPCSVCGHVREVLLRKKATGETWQPCRSCYTSYLNENGIEGGCEMTPTLINDQWEIKLPDFRAARSEWSWWERYRMEFLRDIITPGDVIFDIGAEEGDMTGVYAMWGAKVVAFEPNLPVWTNIKAIWEANNLEPLLAWTTAFAGDYTNSIDIDEEIGDWPASAHGVANGEHGFASYIESNRTKATIRIDDFCKTRDVAPNVITIDVEGAELRVLLGAEETLREHRPIVVCSIHDEIMRYDYDINPAAVHSYMEAQGYCAFLIKQDGHEGHFAYVPQERWGWRTGMVK